MDVTGASSTGQPIPPPPLPTLRFSASEHLGYTQNDLERRKKDTAGENTTGDILILKERIELEEVDIKDALVQPIKEFFREKHLLFVKSNPQRVIAPMGDADLDEDSFHEAGLIAEELFNSLKEWMAQLKGHAEQQARKDQTKLMDIQTATFTAQ